MRISTNTMFETGTAQLGTLQGQLARTQMQLSTNRRLLTAADDPIASARALEVTQSQSMNTQFATNRQGAKSSLSLVGGALQDVTGQIIEIQAMVVAAGNGSYGPSDREALAVELQGRLDSLLALGNTADGIGGYLFSGYKATTQPFSRTATGAEYLGDQGQRSLQVGSSRKMPVTDNGSAVFEANPTGNGYFQTKAAAGNTGSGIVSPGAVANMNQLLGHNYAITFAVSGTPAETTYTVTDASDSRTLVSGVPFQPGKQIAFDGIALEIDGSPANGDTFTVKPSQKQSLFTTVASLIDTLRAPADTPRDRAALVNGLSTAGANLKGALDNVLAVQSSVGARLKELDYLDSSGEDLNVQYAATLSNLQDLDLVKAISLFSQQQMTLQAAQQSFKTMSGLSLFNYL